MFGRKKAKALPPPEDQDARVLLGVELADQLLEMEDANRERKQRTAIILGVIGIFHVGMAYLVPEPLIIAGLVVDFGVLSSAYAWYHRHLRKKIEKKQREFEAVTSSNTPLLP